MNDTEIGSLFAPLLGEDFGDYRWLLDNRPKLAHYTSMHTLEQILKNEEMWFSNPLFMNDLDEMRFGMQQGARLFEQSDDVARACGTAQRLLVARNAFRHFYFHFDAEHAIDVFVFCLSEHDPADTDGVLSMWRAYGRHGDGAALIFNTNYLLPKWDTPLMVAKVSYASAADRVTRLNAKLRDWSAILEAAELPDDKLYIAVHGFFHLVKLYALTSKHKGFSEEREWRIVYLPDRDAKGILRDRLSYALGKRGVEPKLKLQLKPVEPTETWTFSTMLDQIILAACRTRGFQALDLAAGVCLAVDG